GLLDLTTMVVDDLQPVLRHGRGTVHDEMGIGQAAMDLANAIDGEDVARRRARELVGAVAGTDGNGQRVDIGVSDEARGFFGIGQQLAVIEHALGADTVFLTGHAGFQRTEAADFAFHADAAGVRHFHGTARHAHVVVVVHRRLAVFTQRAVHHHRGEAQLDGTLAHRGRYAVVLVHDDGNVRELLDGRLDQVLEEVGTGVLACPGRGLQDDRTVDLVGAHHDGAHLFEVVDVEGRYA